MALSEESIAIVLEQLDKSSFEVENGQLVAISPDGTEILVFLPLTDAATAVGFAPTWFKFYDPRTGVTQEVESSRLNARLAEAWVNSQKQRHIQKVQAAEAERQRPITRDELLAAANIQAWLVRAVVVNVPKNTWFVVSPSELEPERLNPDHRLAGLVWFAYGNEYRTKAMHPDRIWAQKYLDEVVRQTRNKNYNAVELQRALQKGVLFDRGMTKGVR